MKNERNTASPRASRFVEALTDNELLALGAEDLAYIKPVVVNGTHAYAIHGADGEELAVVPNRAVALATVRHNDLDPASVH